MKYCRTPHLPWSKGGTKDDKRLQDVNSFVGKSLVVTEKMDGECTVMSRTHIHSRGDNHYNRAWQTFMKSRWATFKYNIPKEYYICCENMYAVHNIEYTELPVPFFVFGVFDSEMNMFLSWDSVCSVCEVLEFQTVPVILKDVKIENIVDMPIRNSSAFGNKCEGYVVRNSGYFSYDDFQNNVAKCVRRNHNQTKNKNESDSWLISWKKANIRI